VTNPGLGGAVCTKSWAGRRRLGGTENGALRAGPMIVTATVGPLWGSEIPAGAEILGGAVWGALKM